MRALLWIYARDLFLHPTKGLLLLGFNCLYLWLAYVTGRNSFSSFGGVLTLLFLGGGVISGDQASSMLHLTLSRPLKRWHYVTAKWLSLALVSAAWNGLFSALTAYVIYKKTGGAGGQEWGRLLFTQLLITVHGSALMVFLSSWIPLKVEGFAYIALSYPEFLQGICFIFGINSDWIASIAAWANPAMASGFLEESYWRDVSLFSLTLALYLLASCVIMNRKEISYAK